MKDVMAIGDNLNDLSMLEKLAIQLRWKMVQKKLKIAKYVTDTNENSGVGKAIMKLLREQQV